jgi:RimJ/RimL family protein N-acetyltransferase
MISDFVGVIVARWKRAIGGNLWRSLLGCAGFRITGYRAKVRCRHDPELTKLGAMNPSSDIAIREANRADFETWFRLYDTVAAEGRWIGGEAPSDRAARQRAFEANLSDPEAVSFLAEAGSRLVGNLGVAVHSGIGELGMMVDADWRGRGVGSALMEACIAWADRLGAHKLVLEVWPHNTAAQGLYRKYGFEQEGLFIRHYRRRNGELWDAVRMGLVLDLDSPGSPYRPESA